MKLTDAEKLTLTMLSEIHTAMGLDKQGLDSKLIDSAISSDNTWAIQWEYADVLAFDDYENPQEVKEVVDFLDMWSFIEEAFEGMSDQDKAELEQKAKPFGKHVAFPGFDGNNETSHFSAARFMVDKMKGRFTRFAGRDLNSHSPSVGAYRRMFTVFEPWRNDYPGRDLNVDELAEILNARSYRD
ncbi:TPA: YfbU family protein [Enterobacter hormaechei subsp. xiangfangensis]